MAGIFYVRSTKNKTVLPLNANLGVIRSRTGEDHIKVSPTILIAQ